MVHRLMSQETMYTVGRAEGYRGQSCPIQWLQIPSSKAMLGRKLLKSGDDMIDN